MRVPTWPNERAAPTRRKVRFRSVLPLCRSFQAFLFLIPSSLAANAIYIPHDTIRGPYRQRASPQSAAASSVGSLFLEAADPSETVPSSVRRPQRNPDLLVVLEILVMGLVNFVLVYLLCPLTQEDKLAHRINRINTKPITSRSKLTYWAVLDDFMEEAIAARKKGVVIAVCLRVRSRVLTYLLLSIT